MFSVNIYKVPRTISSYNIITGQKIFHQNKKTAPVNKAILCFRDWFLIRSDSLFSVLSSCQRLCQVYLSRPSWSTLFFAHDIDYGRNHVLATFFTGVIPDHVDEGILGCMDVHLQLHFI